jgi:hypothetical protein
MQEPTSTFGLRLTGLIISSLVSFGIQAQTNISSPTEFLGYELGSTFTAHHRVVDYTLHLHDALPSSSLISYGATNEGRPLQLLVLSHPDNLKELESFQEQHLDRIEGGPGLERWDDVAVVWLSYNVHGNEAVSTEAAMKTLYTLVTEKSEWLENLVVIMDPCINPDGRDRYVNWYNQIKSTPFDANPIANEHYED